jgi:hypothetical protein
MNSTKELKVIDFSKEKSFTANGKEYFVETGLSFDRFLMYQMLQIECGYDVSFSTMFDNLKKAYGLLDKLKLADAAVILNNLMHGISKVEDRKIPVLQMCALFINTKDENRKEITNDMVDAKIKDWTEEGLDIRPFFPLALSSIQNFSNAWQEISRNISQQERVSTK